MGSNPTLSAIRPNDLPEAPSLVEEEPPSVLIPWPQGPIDITVSAPWGEVPEQRDFWAELGVEVRAAQSIDQLTEGLTTLGRRWGYVPRVVDLEALGIGETLHVTFFKED